MTVAVLVLLVLNVGVASLHLRLVMRAQSALDKVVVESVVPAVTDLAHVVEAMDKTALRAETAAERAETMLHQLDTKVTLIATTSLGIAEHAEGVADDLRASHQRADQTVGAAGEAADAASRSPESETTNARP